MKIKINVVLLLFPIIFVNANDSTEDHPPFGSMFSDPYTPTTVNFNEIFTNSLSLLNEESPLSNIGKDEDFHLNNLPHQFVEFRQITTSTTTTTTPKPRYLTAAYLHTGSSTSTDSAPPASTDAHTTSKPRHKSTPQSAEPSPSVNVLPLKNTQRGILDLIFPASRVRSFKSVFDTVRRVLSSTFKK